MIYNTYYWTITIPMLLFYYIIHITFPEIRDNKNHIYINYPSFINALITGIPSLYLLSDTNIVNYLSNTDPELITYHYKIVPYMVYAYSIYDIYYGVSILDIPFIIHGLMSFVFLSIGIHYNSIHIGLLACIQENSSIFLNMRINKLMNLLFFLSFTYFRLYKFPLIVLEYIYSDPYNYTVYYLTLTGVTVSTLLNLYWYNKLLRIFFKEVNNYLKIE
jgi:hypothetical protein